MADEDIARQIELNIDTIRKYLKEFDEILAGLQQPPPPEFQKEILAFSNSLSQPIYTLSLYIQDHSMGTASSSSQPESPSSSSPTFDSISGRKIVRAPSLVHRNLETIHCTDCKQMVPIHDFDKHSCPERREVPRISSKSFDSSSDSGTSTPLSSDAKKTDPLLKSGSDPLPLAVSSQEYHSSISLEQTSHDAGPSEKNGSSSHEEEPLPPTVPHLVEDPSSNIEQQNITSETLEKPGSPIGIPKEDFSKLSESTPEIPQVVVEAQPIQCNPASVSDFNSSEFESFSENVNMEELVTPKEKEKEECSIVLEEKVSSPVLESGNDDIALPTLDSASLLLSALENISSLPDSNAFGDASSLMNALQDLSESPLEDTSNGIQDEIAISEEAKETLKCEDDSVNVDEPVTTPLGPESSASLGYDLNSLDVGLLDSLNSQPSIDANNPDLMDALATLSSFAESVPVPQDLGLASDETKEYIPSHDGKADILQALAQLSDFSESPSSIEITAQSSIDENPAQSVDKDSLMASLLYEPSLPSFSDAPSISADLPSLSKDDLLASLSFNPVDSEIPFASSEPQEDSLSLKNDLLASLSLNSLPSDLGGIDSNFSGLDTLSVSGLDNLDSFLLPSDPFSNSNNQEEAPASDLIESPRSVIVEVDAFPAPSSSSLSLKDDLLACLSLDTSPSDNGLGSISFNETEKISLSGLENFVSFSQQPSEFQEEASSEFKVVNESADVARGRGSPSVAVEDEDIPPLSRKDVPPEIEFAEFLSNPKKKQKNYAKIGRVGGRKTKSKFDMKQVLEEVAEGQEPPEFLSMFSPSVPDSVSLADGDQCQWKIAPRTSDDPLIRDFHCSDDTNIAGLRRAKKVNFAQEFGKKKKGKPVLMEDTHYVEYPFKGSERFSLFSIFDGHVGHECAEVARDSFHKILYDIMVRELAIFYIII